MTLRLFAFALGLSAVLGACRVAPVSAEVLESSNADRGNSVVEWSLAEDLGFRGPSDRLRPPSGEFAAAGFVSDRVAYPTGRPETSVLMLERLAPTEVALGGSFTYELRVTNLTPSGLDGVSVCENYGDSFLVESMVPEPTKRAGTTATWDFGSLGPHESRRIVIGGQTHQLGSMDHSATVDYHARVSSTTRVVAPSLRLLLSGPSEALHCRTIPVRLVVTNAGSRSAVDIRVHGGLGDGLFTADGAPEIDFTIDRLRRGESRTFEIPLEASGPGAFLVRLGASVRGASEAPSNLLPLAVREPEVEVHLDGGEEFGLAGRVGGQWTQRVRLTNVGDGVAPKTVVTYRVPPGANVSSVSHGGRLDGQAVHWRIESFAPGAVREYSVVLNGLRPGMMASSVEARAECGQLAQDRFEFELAQASDLSLSMIDMLDPVSMGAECVYAVQLRNGGTEPHHRVQLAIQLPPGADWIGATGASSGTQKGRWVRFDEVETIEADQVLRWDISLRAPGASGSGSTPDVRLDVRAQAFTAEAPDPILAEESTHVQAE